MLKRVYVFNFLCGQWVPCGLLEYQESGRTSFSIFRYGKKYLERKDRVAIDPVQLPLQDRSFETPEGFQIFNGIRDAAPDNWGRYLLDKKFSRTLSEIEYIAASGPARVGSLAFSHSPEQPTIYQPEGWIVFEPHSKLLSLSQNAGAAEDAITSTETVRLKDYLKYGPSIGGARPKAGIFREKEHYLAKFSLGLDTKNEPLIEFATMQLAKKFGLNVPEINVENLDHRHVYLIKRFDREINGPIPFVSGLTITGLHESDFGMWSYFKLADAIIHFSSHPQRDLKELFKRMLFNIAVYNNDDHPRNFGFLYTGNGHWDLSPLYDVVPATIHTDTYNLAMTVGTKGRLASYSNALSMTEKFRLNLSEGKQIVIELKEVISHWQSDFKSVGISASDIKILQNSFKIKD